MTDNALKHAVEEQLAYGADRIRELKETWKSEIPSLMQTVRNHAQQPDAAVPAARKAVALAEKSVLLARAKEESLLKARELVQEIQRRGTDMTEPMRHLEMERSEVLSNIFGMNEMVAEMRAALQQMEQANSARANVASPYDYMSNRFSAEQQLRQSNAYADLARDQLSNLPAEATAHRQLLRQELDMYQSIGETARSKLR